MYRSKPGNNIKQTNLFSKFNTLYCTIIAIYNERLSILQTYNDKMLMCIAILLTVLFENETKIIAFVKYIQNVETFKKAYLFNFYYISAIKQRVNYM